MKTVERDIIVIGASAGGSQAIPRLIAQFTPDIAAAVFVVMHTDSLVSENYLSDLIKKAGFEHCKTAEDGDLIRYGWVFVAPPDHHLMLSKDKMLVVRGPKDNGFRPSIDVLFRSAAATFDSHVIGVVLTGMLDDGTAGLDAINRSGGTSVVQEPSDAAYPDMPLNAINLISDTNTSPIDEMGAMIMKLMEDSVLEQRIPDDIQREADIEQRYTTNIDMTEKFGQQIPVSCPDCGGSLWKVGNSPVNRYRCHTGHTYTEDGLLRGQSKALEETLWVSLRILEERQHLIKKFMDQMTESGRNRMARDYEERLRVVNLHIARIRETLHGDELYSGLVSQPTASRKDQRLATE